MNMNSPYQPLIDIIDILLRKNLTSDNNLITVHVAEIPSLTQNSLGCGEFEDFITRLKNKGVGVQIIKQSGASYKIKKLDTETENALLLEKQILHGIEKKTDSDNKPTSLAGQPSMLKDTEAQIAIGPIACQLPPFQNEHDFCRVMFKYKVGESVDWSVIFEQMSGNAEVIGDDGNKRTVQDTMYAINNRVKKDLNTEDNLFTWKNKSVKRNL